ncbi:hypothetical protein L3Q82_001834 [Scortum barcoo]|uniref:Uncharacterized protein n=1 Tax=Scortum barcoo TaxID=214431 RepID=A0ACB8W4X1_9TELE|nr:hypothetical protein L3Q82_001834 [Scortum barcoo]
MRLWWRLWSPMQWSAGEGGVLSRDKKRLNRLIKRASSVCGCPLDSIEVMGERRALAKLSTYHGQHLPPSASDCGGLKQLLQQQTSDIQGVGKERFRSGVIQDKEENVEEANLEIAQLQGLVAELREGLHAALTELCELRQRDHGLEEKLQAHQTDVDHKIMSLKNSLNTFKGDVTLYFVSSPDKRQRVALELLESERVYVSHLSLLLKANISFNGSEALTSQDKRPFPSSLRFLIQQHLELLHTLQERVLRCQWQGIMGDVFMRLTSKESDFLDFYVSYLKELPDCLSVVSMLSSSSMKSTALLEGLLRQTDAEHPDYYLLLVCIQQFRSFTAQYHHLLQHNQELLLHNRKEAKRSNMKQLLKTMESGIQANNIGSPYPGSSAMIDHANQVKRTKQRLLEQIQSHRFQDWDRDQEPESHSYDAEWPSQLPFFSPDLDPRNHKPTGIQQKQLYNPYHLNAFGIAAIIQSTNLWLSGLGSIPESGSSERSMSCQHHQPSRPADFRQVQPGSALADALGEFLLPPDPPGMESLYEEEGGSFHDGSIFDRCSSASSDSSIDIAFVKCPRASSAPHHAMAANVSTTRDVFGNGGSQGNGYGKLRNRGCVSPDEAVMMRRNQHRPLQASQRKSKSLNGLQMENTVSGLDGAPLSDHLQRVGLGSHAKLERQGSKGSKGCPTPSRKIHSPPGSRVDTDKQSDDLHGLLSVDSGFQSWGDESKWRGGTEDNNHTSFSERSRKQEKGGFRSSFKKLFKKKSSDEKKEKGGEKTPENQNGEHETPGKNAKLSTRWEDFSASGF